MNSTTSGQAVSLVFRLEAEEGWPPVATERLPFRSLPGGFECLTAPLFVKDLAVGDIVSAIIRNDGEVESWGHVLRSNHSTAWILRLASPNNIPEVLALLREGGCNTVGLDDTGTYAVDVPGTVDIRFVDRTLDRLDRRAAATAFPAMRHSDS